MAEFKNDVRAGLTRRGQKQLQPKYFYDELGSALFEAITLLPEYGLTRADERLLDRHAKEVVKRARRLSIIAELGSGTGSKTRRILEALDPRHACTYCPIDVSFSALAQCEMGLRDLATAKILPIHESYLPGLRLAARLRQPQTSMLVLFLGSTIGNLDWELALNLCRQVRQLLQPGDVFLLSTDLQKPVEQMVAAYDDALGVTSAFNMNLLARINRELKGNFNLALFEHFACWNESHERIEMHLRSLSDQIVRIGDVTVRFRSGETIWTESSYKFRPEAVIALAEESGFQCEVQWVDEEWPFAQSLLRAG